MKQVLQNLKNGDTQLIDIPAPKVKPGHLLIRSQSSVLSSGTERMLVEFGKANYLNKARQQPEKVREVVNKVKTDGIMPTFNAVKTKLDQPLILGYSNAGIVIEVGEGVEGYKKGDRVVSNGPHAEIVNVPKNLCAKIPDNVDYDEAAFTIIGAITLQGVRLSQPTIAERFVVMGLGLIGLLTVQILRAQGCEVLATDFDENRLKLAKKFGAETVNLSTGEDPVAWANDFSNGEGIDGVIITATTSSNDPIHQAAQMCRKRGRIILVGVVGLELSRNDFYEKELTFQVSCSYGPGRYDNNYEERGQDYPIGYVRWTEQRNFEAILTLISNGKLDILPLITHKFTIEKSIEAYQTLEQSKDAMGIILQYPKPNKDKELHNTVILNKEKKPKAMKQGKAVIGFIGAGNFTNQVLLPVVKNTDSILKTIASSGGISGVHLGKKYNFESATTETQVIIEDEDINTVFITTPHNTHAKLAKEALDAGKHVFVEKPLGLTNDDLKLIADTEFKNGQSLMVGFNRRFAPHIQKIKSLLRNELEPKTFIMTVNAGEVPYDHWIQDPLIGGGRIIGEVCHFIDLLRYLTGSKIIDFQAIKMGKTPNVKVTEDKVSVTLSFADGSHGTIHYFANGNKAYPKERLEVFCGGKVLMLNNFKSLYGYGWKNFKRMNLNSQDKGHKEEIRAFIESVKNNEDPPIPLNEIFEVSRVSINIAKALVDES